LSGGSLIPRYIEIASFRRNQGTLRTEIAVAILSSALLLEVADYDQASRDCSDWRQLILNMLGDQSALLWPCFDADLWLHLIN
jgi:hypothetical protein